MTDEIQNLINASSMHRQRNLHIYLKMVFDWSVENGQITLTQDPIANNKVKKASSDKEWGSKIRNVKILQKNT